MSSKGRYANVVLIRCEKGSPENYISSESAQDHWKQTLAAKGCFSSDLRKQSENECIWYEEFDSKESCDACMGSDHANNHIKWCSENDYHITVLQSFIN